MSVERRCIPSPALVRGRLLVIASGALMACVEYGEPIVAHGEQATLPDPMHTPAELELTPAPSAPPAATQPGVEPAVGSGDPEQPGAPELPVAIPPEESAEDSSDEPPLPPAVPPSELPLLGTPERPQLDPALAEIMGVLDYLAHAGDLVAGLTRDDWNPSAGAGDPATFVADYVVDRAAGSSASVQAAISAAVEAGGSERRFIEVVAGTYREVVCVPSGAPPITLFGTGADAAQTQIIFDNNAGKPKPAGSAANPCNPNTQASSFGTSGSATFAVMAGDFVALNLSIVNDTDENEATGSMQAVALLVQGDRALFDNVRVLGNQGTLLAKSPDVDTVARAYFKDCFIEGDSEFIRGRGTLVLDGCTVHSLAERVTDTSILGPSTDARNPFGFLLHDTTFSAGAGAEPASIQLGRAWDENHDDVASYLAAVASGVFPNGQILIRESTLGPHIELSEPWRNAASSERPYASVSGDLPESRLYEFANIGPGSAGGAAAP